MNSTPALQEPRERRSVESYLRDPKVIKGLEAVATKYLTPDRMAKIVVNAVRRTPKLAQCNPGSVLGAVMMATSLGLEPNTPMGQAYLVPYDKRGKLRNGQWGVVDTEAQFIIGYRGFISLAKRNPKLIKLYASTVHEGDLFEHMEGSESFLKFQKAMKDRGDPIGSFCFTQERGEYGHIDASTVLPMDELEKIRACSETYNYLTQAVNKAENDYKRNKAVEKLAATPWVMWFDEMAAKSAIRRHVKQLDLTAHLSSAVAMDEAAETGRMDMSKMMDAEYVKAVAEGEAEPEYLEPEDEQSAPALAMPTDQGRVVDIQAQPRQTEPATMQGGGQQGQNQQAQQQDPKEAERREKDSLAAYAQEYGIKLDKRKSLGDLQAEVGQIRDGSHPALPENQPANTPHDPQTGEVLDDQPPAAATHGSFGDFQE